MNILLTNDDGYSSTGILLLKKKLSNYGRVVIVAPKEHMSCTSCSITIDRPVELVKVEDDVYYFDAAPADCVAFGMSSLGINFDLVVSGCNNGLNVSYDINYSGTIGACTQALMYRVPAVAFSCEGNFDLVENEFDNVFKYIIENKLMDNYYSLNVNFPAGKKVKGIKLSDIYYREARTFYKKIDNKYLAARKLDDSIKINRHSDVYLVHHDYVSITPLGRTPFDISAYRSLTRKLRKQK